MASGWAADGAVQDQIDSTVDDAVQRAREALGHGESERYCQECGEAIPEARRKALTACVLPRLPDRTRQNTRPPACTTGAAAKTASCASIICSPFAPSRPRLHRQCIMKVRVSYQY